MILKRLEIKTKDKANFGTFEAKFFFAVANSQIFAKVAWMSFGFYCSANFDSKSKQKSKASDFLKIRTQIALHLTFPKDP